MNISDTSPTFKISNEEHRYIKIIRPNADSIVAPKSDYSITWGSSGADFIKISYSTDNGKSWTTIIPKFKNQGSHQGSYQWSVPDIITDMAQIKIEEVKG